MIVICRDTQNILIATNESTLILFVKQVLSLGLKENMDTRLLASNGAFSRKPRSPIKYC